MEKFDVSEIHKRWAHPGVKSLEAGIEATLCAIFGADTDDYHRYSSASVLDHGSVVMSTGWYGDNTRHDEAAEAQEHVRKGIGDAIALLGEAVRQLEEEIEFASDVNVAIGGNLDSPILKERSKKIFIVHGRDEAARESVARFVEKIGFVPIILHEVANGGRTVIEKIESFADVSFVIVLLTPDDLGCLRGEQERPRARQNVLLELGYFIGKLGRSHVCTLKKGDVDIPSDFAGVLWEEMDNSGGWRGLIAREMQAVGFEIDWNKVMR